MQHDLELYIESVAPKRGRIVICVRSPYSVLNSTIKRPHVVKCKSVREKCSICFPVAKKYERHRKYNRSYSDMVDYYNSYIKMYERMAKEYPSVVKMIRYEDLVADPIKTLGSIVVVDDTENVFDIMGSESRKGMKHIGRDAALEKISKEMTFFDEEDNDYIRDNAIRL